MGQKRKRLMYTRLILFISMAVSIGVYIMIEKDSATPTNSNLSNEFIKIATPIKFENGSDPQIYSDGTNGFYFCTKDGLKFYSSSGQFKWDSVFNMSQPIIVGNKQFVAISEFKGKSLYVYNSVKGIRYSKTFDYPVLSFSINANGYSSVILQNQEDYEIIVYNNEGTALYIRQHQDRNVFPLAAAISNDNKIVAMSFLDINSNISSKLLFAYTDSPRGFTDSIFGGKPFINQIVSSLGFSEDNSLITISEEEINKITFDTSSLVDVKWTHTLSNELDEFGFLGSKGFVLALGKPILNRESENLGTIKIYNFNLDEIGHFPLDKSVTNISTGHNSVIIGSRRSYYALNKNGKLLWNYNSTSDLRYIGFLDNTNTILVATNTEVQILKLSKGKERYEEVEVEEE